MTTTALWTKHRALAKGIASQYFVVGAERQDVEQEALIGLWIATRSWDPDGGASFTTFAALVIRRRLATLVKAALREKHRLLNESVREFRNDDGESVAIIDHIPGAGDPLQTVLDRERLDRIAAAINDLPVAQRDALLRVVNGEPIATKRIDNLVYHARQKLKDAA